MQFQYLDLRLDPPPEPRRPKARVMHWAPTMIGARKVDRVRWPSKIYQFDRMFSRQTLFEQAEQMMDWAAEDFSAWLANLGDPDEATLSADVIKQLFSIATEGDASKALYVEPTVKKAIPDAVAKSMGMPKLSLDFNVARLLRTDEADKRRPSRRLAFGRSLPAGDAFECGPDGIRPLEPDFPPDMRSKRSIFEGITHLRATRTLADYLEENPQIAKPMYLVERQMFAPSAAADADAEADDGPHVPLYKHFVNTD